jgi:hypothetical protein
MITIPEVMMAEFIEETQGAKAALTVGTPRTSAWEVGITKT